jgi:hypothetical protein
MRAVVDTNILVSGLLSAASLPGQVLQDIATGRLRPMVCDAIVAEYRAVLPRARLRIRPDRAARLLQLVELTADWVVVPAYTGASPLPDPADWPFIASALVAACPVITGNARHFPAGLGVRVLTAREWVDGVQR